MRSRGICLCLTIHLAQCPGDPCMLLQNSNASFCLHSWMISLYVFVCLFSSTHLLTDTCFLILALVNNAAMNIGMPLSFLVCFFFFFFFFLDKYPEAELLHHIKVLLFNFWETSVLFFIVAPPIFILINMRAPFSLYPCQHLLFLVFWIMAMLTGARWYLTAVGFLFPGWLTMVSTFSCTCWPFGVL